MYDKPVIHRRAISLFLQISGQVMNKGIFRFMVLGIILLSAASCCRKRAYCDSATLNFAFTGFKKTEIRSFILRRYAIGNQWGKALDSATYVYTGTGSESPAGDTVELSDYSTVGNLGGITAGNDWGIYLPALGKTFFITTIFENDKRYELVKCGDDETRCSKDIRNFSVNDGWKDGGFAYLDKKDIK